MSQPSPFKQKVVPIIIASLGSFLLSATALQSPILTYYTETATINDKIAASISITSVCVHFLTTILAYITESPVSNNIPVTQLQLQSQTSLQQQVPLSQLV